MDGKKLSFGFSKTAKKPSLVVAPKKEETSVQFIECLEGQSIKIKDAIEEIKAPLIIPVRESKKGSIVHQLTQNQLKNKESYEEQKPESEMTPDEVAARELINDAQNRLNNHTVETKVLQLPIPVDDLPLDGEKEPTLDDYESVPISQYGMAMLRGMGWEEGMSIGKNTSNLINLAAPELRPKGLGLGATKAVQSETPKNKATDKDGKELTITKGAFAKVIAGAQKGNYCEVQGYDNEEGRIIVKLFPKGNISNMNELLLTPVTKEEFSKGSKVLNNAKYEEYKEQSDIKLEKYRENNVKAENVKGEPRDSKHNNDGYKEERVHKEDKYKTKERRRQSSESSENNDKYVRSKNSSKETRKDKDSSSNSRAKTGHEKNNSSSDNDNSKYRRSGSKEQISKHKSVYREYSEEKIRKSYKSRNDNTDQSSSEEEIEKYQRNRSKSKNKSKYRDSRGENSKKSSNKSRNRSRSHSPKEKRSMTKKHYRSKSSSEERDRRKNKTKSRDRSRSKSFDRKRESRHKKEYREKDKNIKSKSKHRKSSSSSSSESSSDNKKRYKNRR